VYVALRPVRQTFKGLCPFHRLGVCAPVHDALLVEGEADKIEEVVTSVREAMLEASAVDLSGFQLRTDAKIVRYPDRYMDERGVKMWETVQGILAELDQPAAAEATCSADAHPTCAATLQEGVVATHSRPL